MLMGGCTTRLRLVTEEGLVQGRLRGPLTVSSSADLRQGDLHGQAAPENEPARAGGERSSRSAHFIGDAR